MWDKCVIDMKPDLQVLATVLSSPNKFIKDVTLNLVEAFHCCNQICLGFYKEGISCFGR